MKLKIILIISVILMLSACTQSGSRVSKTDVVTLDFIQNMPPSGKLYEEQNFRVGLNVVNFEEKEKSVLVCIFDSLSDFTGGIPPGICDNIKLKPAYKFQNEIKGTEEKIYFPDKDNYFNYKQVEGTMSTNIFAELYYIHKTIARSQMCIKRDIDVKPTGVVCELSSQEVIENNDAPVQITKLKKDIFPAGKNKVNIILEFDIQNKGTGTVIDKSTIFSNQEKDSVIDLDVKLEGKFPITLKCEGLLNKRLLFREGQKTITCEGSIDMTEEFSMQNVIITLDYGYKLEKVSNSISLIDKDIYK